MSKKSRRRNRRLLKALGAGLAIAGLGGAFRKNTKGSTDADTVKLMTSDKAYKLPNVKENEFKEKIYQDAIMRGDVGVKPARIFPKLSVTKKGEVIRNGVNTGVQNKKTAFVGDKYIYKDGKPYTKGRFGTFAAQKQMERGALPPQLRVPKIKNLYEDSMLGDTREIMAKGGGRITKTGVKRGAAKRGFGRAFKGGK